MSARCVRFRFAATGVVMALAAVAPAQSGWAADAEPWAKLRPLRGVLRQVLVEPGQTLHDVAAENQVGFEALVRLNPGLDPWLPPRGTLVELPTQSVMPTGDPVGLVINVPEMRLFDFTDAIDVVFIPVAIGDPEDPTPIGEFAIGRKLEDPAWYVPASIRDEKGWLGEAVPPGPDNPLGRHWMSLGDTSYGIHGTNVRWSIGRMSTHGCVRLYEQQMADLFARIPRGTPVRILYEPYKWGSDGLRLYLEAHPDPYGRIDDPLDAALALPRELGVLSMIDTARVARVVEEARGVPVLVGELR